MSFDTDAVVLRVTDTGESDRLLTLLTRDRGVVRAFAKSARRPKNKLHACTNLFCCGRFSFFEGSTALRVTECEMTEMFYALRNDMTALALGQYFAELSVEFAPADSDSSELFRLLLNSLHFLAKGDRDPEVLKSVFEMRLACISGYMPDMVGCADCGAFESEKMYLDIENGLLYCDKCGRRSMREMSPGTVNAVRHICYSELNRLFTLKAGENGKYQLGKLCEDYILSKTNHRFPTLDFYNTIK